MEHNKNTDPLHDDGDERLVPEHERGSLPPGHPISWGVLVNGTSLAGLAYPGLALWPRPGRPPAQGRATA